MALLAEAIYTNSAHQHVIGIVNIIKNGFESSVSVAQMVKRVPWAFWRDRPGFESAFCQKKKSPFSNLISHRKGIYFQ